MIYAQTHIVLVARGIKDKLVREAWLRLFGSIDIVVDPAPFPALQVVDPYVVLLLRYQLHSACQPPGMLTLTVVSWGGARSRTKPESKVNSLLLASSTALAVKPASGPPFSP